MQEVGPTRLLRAARDHGLVPADLHARGDRGAALQAARVHEDLRDGLRGAALGDAHARARGAARSAGSIRSEARASGRTALLVRAYAPVVRCVVRRRGARRRRRRCSRSRRPSRSSCARQRVHAAARTRARSSTCRPRRPGMSIDRGGARAPAAWTASSRAFPEVERVFGKIGRAETRDRSGAALDGRDGHHAEARARVAARA